MAEPSTTLEAVSLPPSEAMAFLRGKTNTTSQRWTDVWNEAHTRSFMVAGAATKEIVQDFRVAVTKAIEQGTTLAEFRKDFDAIVAKHGWVHNGTPGWRASIIYETNLSTAYSAGRYIQMSDPDVLEVYPYWQYMHTSSARPRPQHLAWVGTTLRHDDPWWSTHYPPNGWRCKCSVRPVSAAGLRRQGKTGPDTAPPLDLRPWRSRDGRVVTEVPYGIDPGFGYNPGQAWKDGLPPPPTPKSPLQPVRPRMPPAEAVGRPEPVKPGPIGPLGKDVQRALGVDTDDAILSKETLAKQIEHHPDLTADEYATIPTLLSDPAMVLRLDGTRLRLIGAGPAGYPLTAVIKKTAAQEVYIATVHRARRSDLQRYVRAFEVLIGSIALLDDRQKQSGAPERPPSNPSSRSGP